MTIFGENEVFDFFFMGRTIIGVEVTGVAGEGWERAWWKGFGVGEVAFGMGRFLDWAIFRIGFSIFWIRNGSCQIYFRFIRMFR